MFKLECLFLAIFITASSSVKLNRTDDEINKMAPMPMQNRTSQNGPGQNGPGQNGPGQNGPGQNGSSQNGPGQNEPDENRQDMQYMPKDQEILPDLVVIMNECNETFRIEMAFLESLNDSGTFPDETDKTPMCYMRCFLEKAGVASPEGEYDASRAATVFSKERQGRSHDDLEGSAKACTDRSESCKCERAYNFMRCLIENDMEKHEAPYTAEPEEDSK